MINTITSLNRTSISQWFAAVARRGYWQWGLAIGLMLLTNASYSQANIFEWISDKSSPPVEKKEMRLNSFSPDNRLLSFDFCRDKKCFPGLLDLHSGEITKIIPPDPDEWWSSGVFSPSGKYLAFAVKRDSENSHWSQLGLYDMSTHAMKILTYTESFKEFPSFSPDEKRLIYAQANKERTSGKTRFSHWDIYELDIDNGQERGLTDYQFFLIGRPFYLPDGRHFIFSGEAPHSFEGKTGMDAFYAYEKKYQGNIIFIFGQENTELQPALINGPLTDGPKISRDGKRIIYHARSDEMDRATGEKIGGFTYDLFMLEDGHHRRLTKLKYSLRSFTTSPDGSLIAYTSDPKENGEIHLWLLDIARNETREIEIATDVLFDKN